MSENRIITTDELMQVQNALSGAVNDLTRYAQQAPTAGIAERIGDSLTAINDAQNLIGTVALARPAVTVGYALHGYASRSAMVEYIAALMRYIEQGIAPGDFLRAVLENDLLRAVKQMNPPDIDVLHALIEWLQEHAPSAAWGSPSAVDQHLEREWRSKVETGCEH